VLEYASKFIELFHFVVAFMAGEKLKMNHFEAWLNPNLKERIRCISISPIKICTTQLSMWRG